MRFSIKLLLYTAIGLVLAFLVAWNQGLFAVTTTHDILRVVCDGFFVAGALFLGWGGLKWTYNGGVMDGLGYSFKSIINRMRPSYDEHRETFSEYRERREQKATSPKLTLVSGLILLACAMIVYIAYTGLV